MKFNGRLTCDQSPSNLKSQVNGDHEKQQENKGAWTAEEDQKLAEVFAVHGSKRWKTIAAKAGLNRCGKSCRLRWLNYLRPNIKRGNITDQEEDLILRLHKLLGNRWSLIAGRLPGPTDNEIKNYWNSHLSKKINPKQKASPATPRKGHPKADKAQGPAESSAEAKPVQERREARVTVTSDSSAKLSNPSFASHAADDDFFDFSNESPLNLEWVSWFLEFDRRHHHHQS